jgi:hypothetical protein
MMNEKIIRVALRKAVFQRYANLPDAAVLEEVGLLHGAARIDFLVVNGALHGFEVKSDRDTLRRLPEQARFYNRVLDRITLVVGYRLADAAIRLIPEWWGVKLVDQGKRGAVRFLDARRPKGNHLVQSDAVVKLLWKSEALEFLRTLRAEEGIQWRTRKAIYATLMQFADLNLIRTQVSHYLIARKAQLSAGPRKSGGG